MATGFYLCFLQIMLFCLVLQVVCACAIKVQIYDLPFSWDQTFHKSSSLALKPTIMVDRLTELTGMNNFISWNTIQQSLVQLFFCTGAPVSDLECLKGLMAYPNPQGPVV